MRLFLGGRVSLLVFLMLASLLARGGSVRLRLVLEGTVPDMVRLGQLTPVGERFLDTCWPGVDGAYQFMLEDFAPGFYTLRFGENSEALRLLLLRPEGQVTVRAFGSSLLDSARVIGAVEADVYVRAQRYRAEWALWHRFSRSLAATGVVDSEPARQYARLLRSVDSLYVVRMEELRSAVIGETERALLSLMEPVEGSDGVEVFFPPVALRERVFASSVELGARLEEYILAHRSDLYRRAQQDSAYLSAVGQLAGCEMDSVVARRLRSQMVYVFSGGHYDALADSVLSIRFGPLQGLAVRGETIPILSARELRSLYCVGADGTRVRLIDREAEYTLLAFWSVWCSHCQAMLPRLATWYVGLPTGRLSVRGVVVDERAEALAGQVDFRGWPWVNVVDDAEGLMQHLVEGFGVELVPSYLLFRRDGTLVGRLASLEQLFVEVGG